MLVSRSGLATRFGFGLKPLNSASILNQSKTSSNCSRKYMSNFLVSYCRWELQTFCSGKHLQECVRFQSNLNLNHFSVLLFFLLIRLIKDNKKKGCRGCFFLCACISTFLLIQHQYVSLCLEFDFILENAQKKKPNSCVSKTLSLFAFAIYKFCCWVDELPTTLEGDLLHFILELIRNKNTKETILWHALFREKKFLNFVLWFPF